MSNITSHVVCHFEEEEMQMILVLPMAALVIRHCHFFTHEISCIYCICFVLSPLRSCVIQRLLVVLSLFIPCTETMTKYYFYLDIVYILFCAKQLLL